VVEMIEDDLGKGGCIKSVGSGCCARRSGNQTKKQWYQYRENILVGGN